MRVAVQPVWEDNYQFVIFTPSGVIAVDPAEDGPVQAAMADHGLPLVAILLTHHHADHVSGVSGLRARWKTPVYGPADVALPQVTHPVADDDLITPASIEFRVLSVPGHTFTHVAYYSAQAGWVFAGDVLFTMGCGRLAPGMDPARFHASIQRLAGLPPSTQLYSGHEYSETNARFACSVSPDDEAVRARAEALAGLRGKGRPTVPSIIADERATNPFVRATDAQAFAVLRARKDRFS